MHLSVEKRWVWGFFAAALLIGLAAAPRYGVSWDEPNMVNLGNDAWNYVLGNGEWPETAGRRFHGPLVEMGLVAVQRIFGITDPRPVFVMRHILTYGIFLGGLAAFYALAKRIFGDWELALIGVAMLFLSPRIFAHAFYNSRDIPNMVLWIGAMLTLTRLMEHPTAGRAMLHGVLTAAAIAVRSISILIIPISIIIFMGNSGMSKPINKSTNQQMAYCVAFYLFVCAIFTYVFWPFLWEAPVRNMRDVLAFMASLSHEVFYFGAMQTPPWHYLPVWIAITTPFVYCAFFFAGLRSAIGDKLWMPLLWCFLPFLTVIATRAGIYDDWRHVYFLYPGFLLIALKGVRQMGYSKAVMTVLTASCIWTGAWMIQNHPLQGTYFSLPGRFVAKDMERDYWGLSFKEGLMYILRNDPSAKIAISATSPPGYFAAFTLPEEDQQRIVFNEEHPTYVLDNFRTSQYEEHFPEEKKIHEITVDGLTVLAIYKIR